MTMPLEALPWILLAIALARSVLTAARLQAARRDLALASARLQQALTTMDAMASHEGRESASLLESAAAAMEAARAHAGHVVGAGSRAHA